MNEAVIAGAAAVLVHTPSLVRHGAKPARELATHPGLLPEILGSLHSFEQAVSYRPNQAFIGAIHPRKMGERPWIKRPVTASIWTVWCKAA